MVHVKHEITEKFKIQAVNCFPNLFHKYELTLGMYVKSVQTQKKKSLNVFFCANLTVMQDKYKRMIAWECYSTSFFKKLHDLRYSCLY